MANCENCKFWTEHRMSPREIRVNGSICHYRFGICESPVYLEDGGFELQLEAADDADVYGWFKTSNKFGCVLFQQREAK